MLAAPAVDVLTMPIVIGLETVTPPASGRAVGVEPPLPTAPGAVPPPPAATEPEVLTEVPPPARPPSTGPAGAPPPCGCCCVPSAASAPPAFEVVEVMATVLPHPARRSTASSAGALRIM